MIKINNSKDPRMVLVHEQPGKGGLRFYRFKNPEEFPALRGLAAERAKRFAAMNLTEKELRALVKECKMKAGQQDLVTAFAIIHEIEFRLDFISEENSMLDLACLYYVLEDESPDTPSAEANTRKLAYMKNNPDARAFFFARGVADYQPLWQQIARRAPRLYRGDGPSGGADQTLFAAAADEQFGDWLAKAPLHAVEGRITDMDALERKTFLEWAVIIDAYLEKCEHAQRMIDDMGKPSAGSGRKVRSRGSKKR